MCATTEKPILSEFASDPEMRELIEHFVGVLPERSAAMQERCSQGEWSALRRLAHQMCGAADGYGFPTLGSIAKELQREIDAGNHHQAPALIQQFTNMANRCSAEGSH